MQSMTDSPTPDDQTPTAAGRPSWLTQPCPIWCTNDHHESDYPEDRYHSSESVEVPTSLERSVKADNDWEPEYMHVFLRQGWLEAEPQVWVDKGDSETFKLRLGEAGLVATGLSDLVSQARR